MKREMNNADDKQTQQQQHERQPQPQPQPQRPARSKRVLLWLLAAIAFAAIVIIGMRSCAVIKHAALPGRVEPEDGDRDSEVFKNKELAKEHAEANRERGDEHSKNDRTAGDASQSRKASKSEGETDRRPSSHTGETHGTDAQPQQGPQGAERNDEQEGARAEGLERAKRSALMSRKISEAREAVHQEKAAEEAAEDAGPKGERQSPVGGVPDDLPPPR